VAEPSQSTEETDIRALVDAAACPMAISDLKVISKSMRKHGNRNNMQVAMDVYTEVEASVFRGGRMKIFAAISICGKFERQRDIWQRNLKKEKVKDAKMPSGMKGTLLIRKLAVPAKQQPPSQSIYLLLNGWASILLRWPSILSIMTPRKL
jgi:hypothetical protein